MIRGELLHNKRPTMTAKLESLGYQKGGCMDSGEERDLTEYQDTGESSCFITQSSRRESATRELMEHADGLLVRKNQLTVQIFTL
jgi:hypothetical protein